MMIKKQIQENIKNEIPSFFKGAFPKLFSWKELEFLLNCRPLMSTTRVKFINHIDPKDKHKSDINFIWKRTPWLSDKKTFPPSVLESQLKTYHCIIHDMSRVNEGINQICCELENIIPNSASDAHIYFNLSNDLTGGFRIHQDEPHVLLIQAEGNSEFKIWDANKSKNPYNNEPTISGMLEVGDSIFIPSRCYHEIQSKSKRMSISFPISINVGTPQERSWIHLNKYLNETE